MKVTVLAVSQRAARWVDDAVSDYVQRFPRDFVVSIELIRPEPRDHKTPAAALFAEATRIRARLPAGSLTVALDEHGSNWTTGQFADALRDWRDRGESPAFVIGGADGLDPAFKREARLQLRLSSLTLPHALARVLLVEQLYRAWSLLANHPYHRA